MKRLIVLMLCAAAVSGCTHGGLARTSPMPVWVADTEQVQAAKAAASAGMEIERVPFRAGVSSTTVENMAKAQGCAGGQGAGLMTPQGPVEVYRMLCDNRAVFMARCEFRQCRPMSRSSAGGNTLAPRRQ